MNRIVFGCIFSFYPVKHILAKKAHLNREKEAGRGSPCFHLRSRFGVFFGGTEEQMNEEKHLILKAVSLLLQYPDGGLEGLLDTIDEAMGEQLIGGVAERLADVSGYMRKTPLLKLQEEYSKTFDLDPKMSLNITYHRWGDKRERGNALAKLGEIYKSAGCEAETSELPDYLPLMLEFFSISSTAHCHDIIKDYRPEIEGLGSRLKEAESPYATLIEIVLDTIESK